MKNYVKPIVNVVSLKSSEDIAAKKTFNTIKQGMVDDYLNNMDIKKYALSKYAMSTSNITNPSELG